MESILITEIDKSVRSVMRPYMPCSECNNIVVLEWKDGATIYWKHDLFSSCSGKNNTFIFARRYLYYLFKDKFSINVQGRCTNCKEEWRKTLPFLVAKRTLPLTEEKNNQIQANLEEDKTSSHLGDKCLLKREKSSDDHLDFKEEYSYLGKDDKIYILDIVALHPNGNIAFAIKLCSETDVHDQTFDFPYYGISSVDLLDNYDRVQSGKNTYVDRRCKQLCNSYCISNKQVGFILGYAIKIKSYPCEAVCIVEKAYSGYYFSNSELWNLDGYRNIVETDYMRKIWDNFLSKSQCIKCNRKDPNIAYKRPYCNSCYGTISNSDGGSFCSTKMFVGEVEKKKLRKNLSWLNKIPKRSSNKDPCFFCNKNYFSRKDNEGLEKFWDPRFGYVINYVNWFGGKKSCCSVCLEEQMGKREFLN